MIKAIFFDIDETLISKNHPQISDGVVNALKCLREKGIKLPEKNFLIVYIVNKKMLTFNR